MLGIIGGTGIYSLGKFEERNINTPYGFAEVYIGKIGRMECAFVPRHGKDHRYAPHKVNYRANISALAQLEVEGVFATYACGVISKYEPGDLIAAEDFLGFNAPVTFYEDFASGMKHVDFSEPYAQDMRRLLLGAGRGAGVKIKAGGIVATMHGPRFETRVEIRALKGMGANLVSMTNAYEATLLHELEIPCAGLCIATNYACGVSKERLSHSEVVRMMKKKEREVNRIIAEFAGTV